MKLTEQQIAKMSEYGIPGGMAGGLIRYFENRIPPGDFLTAVLENDLMEAFGRADMQNEHCMKAYCTWLYNQAPIGSYGTKQAVINWLNKPEKLLDDDDVDNDALGLAEMDRQQSER